MGTIETIIVDKLRGQFAPAVLQVINESFMHSVPAGSESHFKVVLASDQFVGKRQVQRHQAVYAALASELAGPVHALALHTYSPEEWSANQGGAPDSPKCLGQNRSQE